MIEEDYAEEPIVPFVYEVVMNQHGVRLRGIQYPSKDVFGSSKIIMHCQSNVALYNEEQTKTNLITTDFLTLLD